MMYGILELGEVFSLWKSGIEEKKESFAVSFSSKTKKAPLVFTGLSSIFECLNKKIFSMEEIAYLHSLQKKDGEFLFIDSFIKFLSDLTFDVTIEAPYEGTVIFPGEPVLKVIGSTMVLPFFKKLLEYYLPIQIQIATKVEKITSFIAPAYVVTESFKRAFEGNSPLDSKSAYIGGAIACEDLSAAAAFTIPICFHEEDSELVFLDVLDKHFNQKVALLEPKDKVFLKGGVNLQLLQDYPYLIPQLKGISIKLCEQDFEEVSMRYHHYRRADVLSFDFKIYRFSHKGLYIGDILTCAHELDGRKTVFGKSIQQLTKEELLVDISLMDREHIDILRARTLKNMRLLPCKYRNNCSSGYPVRILRKTKVQENLESLSNTRPA